MKKLVLRFMDKLDISRRNAITRISFIFFFIVCFIATIILAVILFPNKRIIAEKVILPWNNTVIIKEIPEEKILLEEKQFDSLFTEPIYISFLKHDIVFWGEIKGVYFYYIPKINFRSNSNTYYLSSIKYVEENIIIVEKTRDIISLTIKHVILPFLICWAISLLAFNMQLKFNGFKPTKDGLQSKYLKVWG